MKRITIGLLVLTVNIMIVSFSNAETNLYTGASIRILYINSYNYEETSSGNGDYEADGSGFMVGASYSKDLSEKWWVSFQGMVGMFDLEANDNGIEQQDDIVLFDGEVVTAKDLTPFDLGVGLRLISIQFKDQNKDSIFAPLPFLYVNAGGWLPNSNLGWYSNGQILYPGGYSIEAGISANLNDRSSMALGYRVLNISGTLNGVDIDGKFAGFAGTYSFSF